MEKKSLYAMTPQSLVHGWKDIGKTFGVSHVIVKRWAADGAPVVMVTAEMPCVAVGELWEWLKNRQQGKGSTLAEKEFTPCRETHRNAAPRHESGKHEATQGHGKENSLDAVECPYCGSVGTLHKRGDGYRCEYCRQLFELEEIDPSLEDD